MRQKQLISNKCFQAVLFCIVAFSVLLPYSSGAFAHSQLIDSTPTPNEVLESSPKYISVTFSEKIEMNRDGIRLFDQEGEAIALPKPEVSAAKATVRVPDLKPGTYIVSYQVISEDTHPVKGSFIFSVRSELKTDIVNEKNISKAISSSQSTLEKSISLINKTILFASLALIIALILLNVFNVLEISKEANKLLRITLLVCIITSLISIYLYSKTSQGVSFLSVFTSGNLGEDLLTRYSISAFARICLCIGILIFSFFNQKNLRFLAGIAGIALAFSLSLSGHSVVSAVPVATIVFDAIHVLAASLWFGGIIISSIGPKGVREAIDLNRFSRLAQIAVVLIAITGVIAGIRLVGSLGALTGTIYGKLLLIKIIGFILVVAIAFFTRRSLRSAKSNEDPSQKTKTRRFIQLEAIIIIIVMVATSLLTSSIPAKQAYAQTISKRIPVSVGYIELTVDPPRAGAVDFHVFLLDKNGTPYPLSSGIKTLGTDIIEVKISNKSKEIEDISIPMKFQSLNHFVSMGATIPFAGTWDVDISILISDFQSVNATTQINVL